MWILYTGDDWVGFGEYLFLKVFEATKGECAPEPMPQGFLFGPFS